MINELIDADEWIKNNCPHVNKPGYPQSACNELACHYCTEYGIGSFGTCRIWYITMEGSIYDNSKHEPYDDFVKRFAKLDTILKQE